MPPQSQPPVGTGGASASSEQRDQQHAWEQTDSAQMWSAVQEDADGNLLTASSSYDEAALVRLRRRRLSRSDGARSHLRLVRDMIRYVYVVLDCSRAMHERDPALPGAATRFDAALQVLSAFVREYYDQNPLSQLGLIAVRDGEAEMAARLTGSRSAVGAALVQLRKNVGRAVASNPNSAGGVFSLQNGLEVAGRSLGHMPRYGSREVVVIMGSLAACDPGDALRDTLPKLRAASVRVSTVHLQAEVNVCRRLADETGGTMGICLDRGHLRDLVMGQCTPPPARPGPDEEEDGSGKGKKRRRTVRCEFVPMGFPSHRTDDVPSLVHAGSARGGASDAHRALLSRSGHVCPRCQAKTADLPADCAVCGLKLVSAPHLARSFHHLFPVPPFAEVAEEVDVTHTGGSDDGTNINAIASDADAAAIVGSAPPSCVASDADVASSAFVIGSSGGGGDDGATPTTTRMVTIDARLLVTSRDCDRCCYGCLKIIGVRKPTPTTAKSKKNSGGQAAAAAAPPDDPGAHRPEPLRFQCPDCRNVFCADCDAYLHEALHNCPGCLCAG
jgi:transcription initiation factor TFIIH subunit 2